MKYLLDSHYALRSWRWVPYAVYRRNAPQARPVSRELFSLLKSCDGQQELPESAQLAQLVRDGIVHPAAEGARLTSWQEHLDCDNRYVPALYLSITGKCNFNCRHCFNAADNAPLMSQWDYDEYLAFLDECCAAGIHAFFITGGEPMVHPRFMDMMRAIYERDMFVFRIDEPASVLDELSCHLGLV